MTEATIRVGRAGHVRRTDLDRRADLGLLGLMVDGMDLMFLSYSLPALIEDFQISRVQAGSLASYSCQESSAARPDSLTNG